MIYYYIFFLVLYIIRSYGMYIIGLNRGVYTPGLACLPIGQTWVLGDAADNIISIEKSKWTAYRKYMVALSIFCILLFCILIHIHRNTSIQLTSLAVIPVWVFAIAGLIIYLVLHCYTKFYIYKSLTDKYILAFVLTLVFPVIEPFFLFAYRNKQSVYWKNMTQNI